MRLTNIIRKTPFRIAFVAGGAALCLASCEHGVDKKKARKLASDALSIRVESPESLKIVSISEPDSLFGSAYFTNSELEKIHENLQTFNDQLWGDGTSPGAFDSTDPAICAKMDRAIAASEVLNLTLKNIDAEKGPFNGWMVKAVYMARDLHGFDIGGTYYFVFDKELNHIIHSFEIPIL